MYIMASTIITILAIALVGMTLTFTGGLTDTSTNGYFCEDTDVYTSCTTISDSRDIDNYECTTGTGSTEYCEMGWMYVTNSDLEKRTNQKIKQYSGLTKRDLSYSREAD